MRSREQLPHLAELTEARRVLDSPVLAISAEWLRQVRDAFSIRDRAQLQALRFGWASAVQACDVIQGVGVIGIRGALLQGSWIHDYTDILAAVNEHAENPAVHAILLDIDSPGGDVHAEQFALADRIREVRAEKPVWALANEQATSAAYVIAAQASKIFAANPNTAIVGSLGVIATHTDWSKYDERVGITTTEVVTGRHKNELSPNRPLSKEGRATLERLVEGAFVELIGAVTAGRKGLTEEKIRAQEAAIYLGGEGQEQGLVDGIALREELIERLAKKAQGQGVFVPAASAEPGAEQETAEEEGVMPEPTNPTPALPATPAGAQPAAAATPGGATVVNIDEARQAGAQAERARAAEIQDLCRLAGFPERAADFIVSGTAIVDVRRALLDARASAAGPEIDGHPPAASPGRRIDTAAIYQKWNAMMNPGKPKAATSARAEG